MRQFTETLRTLRMSLIDIAKVLKQEHSGSDDSLYLVKHIPSNGPRARFHGALFEIVKSTKLAISVRQKQTHISLYHTELKFQEMMGKLNS